MTSDAEKQEYANQEFAALDMSDMRFPSDLLTILNLRKTHPELFDRGFEEYQPKYFLQDRPLNPARDAGVGSAMMVERQIALAAYAVVKGLPGPQAWDDIERYKPELVQFYCKHGLASGEYQAAELIRDIERQATQLSKDKGR